MPSHNRKISVIGLGYVGLPVAVAFGKKSRVIGFDTSESRIALLKDYRDDTGEVSGDDLKSSDVLFTSVPSDLRKADFHIVAVPTPVNSAKQPDLNYLMKASELLSGQLKKGDIVVYESTVYPGATEEECVPVLEKGSGLTCGEDFFVGYSPERINPGDKTHRFTDIIKVVAGMNDGILDIIADVYGSVVRAGVYRASSIKVAEAAKVIENTQRDLNIALMNELALIFQKLDIDTGEVLAAAGTKWNFLPFSPGLVGGHCIGVDPYYLTYKASNIGYNSRVILAGRSINDAMGRYVARMVIKDLINEGHVVKDSYVTVLGVTFKENVPDIRNSRVIDIINELEDYDIRVQVHDFHANPEETYKEYKIKLQKADNMKSADAVILAVAHEEYISAGWPFIQKLLVDNRGVVFDVKCALDRTAVPEGIKLKRL